MAHHGSAFGRINPKEWEGLDVSFEGGRFVAIARCAHPDCMAAERWSARSMAGPEVTLTKFRLKRWGFKHRQPYCPEHMRPRKDKAPMPAPDTSRPALSLAADNDAPKLTPSDAAKVQRRMVYMAVEDAYDEDAKRYKPGHTDDTVSKAVGAPVALVGKVREEFFGPAAPPEPPEVRALREEFQALSASAASTKSEAEALHRKAAEQAVMAVGLERRLDRLCGSLGWGG